jgi:hypothetical protein
MNVMAIQHLFYGDGKMTNIYHYHLNREYPYAIGRLHGVVELCQSITQYRHDRRSQLRQAITNLSTGRNKSRSSKQHRSIYIILKTSYNYRPKVINFQAI